jgi:hypothetical protein
VANFDRNQLRVDNRTGVNGTTADGVQKLYPGYDWGALAVWAWGAAAVVDFVLADAVLLPMVDPTKVMSIGHSRGGKTALWHAAVDERVSAVFPLMSGEGGCGALRVATACNRTGVCLSSESVADIVRVFPYWFGPRYAGFAGHEGLAPWDQHWQRMLVAPRAQLGLEGLHNEHENPIGSQATYVAAKIIYQWFKVRA